VQGFFFLFGERSGGREEEGSVINITISSLIYIKYAYAS